MTLRRVLTRFLAPAIFLLSAATAMFLLSASVAGAADSTGGSDSASAEAIPSEADLESSGAVIGVILIDNENIFNPEDPREDHKLFRLANRLHIKTRAYVVREQ